MGFRIKTDRSRARLLAFRAMEAGADRKGLLSFSWDVSHRCERPVGLEIVGSPDTLCDKDQRTGAFIDMLVRCRKCPACMKVRQMLWTYRAKAEMDASARTWFGTLTFSPERYAYYLGLARLRCDKSGFDFDAMGETDRVRYFNTEAGKAVTKWLKRVRRGQTEYGEDSDRPFRYLCVMEAGTKRGRLHYHVLIHETDPDRPIVYRKLQNHWRDGFTHFKLVDPDTHRRTAFYVAKYLAKSALARVRASKRYGEDALPAQPPTGA